MKVYSSITCKGFLSLYPLPYQPPQFYLCQRQSCHDYPAVLVQTVPVVQNSNTTNPDGSTYKKQHVCHYPNCSKVYAAGSLIFMHTFASTLENDSYHYCGMQFKRSSNLQRHSCTHTGEKQFFCAECGMHFMRRNHLNKHIKTHLLEKETIIAYLVAGVLSIYMVIIDSFLLQ